MCTYMHTCTACLTRSRSVMYVNVHMHLYKHKYIETHMYTTCRRGCADDLDPPTRFGSAMYVYTYTYMYINMCICIYKYMHIRMNI